MLKLFGILGDVHTEDEALALALERLGRQPLDAILCVGDVVDGRGDADRTCALLRDASVITVAGNHDRWLVDDTQLGWEDDTRDLHDSHREWLASLPATRRFDTPLGGMMLCHGVGEDDMSRLRPDTDELTMQWMEPLHALQSDETLSLMVGGHTHERMVRALPGLTVINAGTLHRDYAPGFLLADLSRGAIQAYDVDARGVRDAEIYVLEGAG